MRFEPYSGGSAMRRCFLPLFVAVLSLPVLGFLFEPAQAQPPAKDAFTSKATRVVSAGFLQVPAYLKAEGFEVARKAPTVDVCFFAGLKDGQGAPWSSWGDGCFASNGKYYTSVGDHQGKDGNSFVYEYDPMTQMLQRVVDVLDAILHMLGFYGHGKIHSGIHEAADGSLWFSTYWGKHREVDKAFGKGGFEGSVLLRFDPKTRKTENLGAIVPRQGLPASAFDPERQHLFFHAVYEGDVCVYDVKARKVKFRGGADASSAHRTFMVDRAGRAWFSGKDGLLRYDPKTNAIEATKITLPATPGSKKGDTLRAAAAPTKDGILYGMTAAGRMFALDSRKGTVKDLGPNFGGGDYTAVMVLSPDEKYLYYAPGAHGSGNKTGAPVVQYEIATGKRKVLAFLKDTLAERFKYQVGGTYNLQIDPAGERLFITFNGAMPGQRGTFGTPSVLVLHIPREER